MAFLKVVSLEKALEIINSFPLKPTIEEIEIEEAHGRILAEDIISPIDVPPFDRASVDGYALKSQDTWNASESNPVVLKIIGEVHAGEEPKVEVGDGETVYISTGAILPKGADAVIEFEVVEREGDKVIIYKPVYPQAGVMKAGTDISKGKPLLKKGTKLGFKETALFSAIGFERVKVFSKPKVAIISTGNEIILPGDELRPGKIYDINGRAVSDAVKELGGEPHFIGIAEDNRESLKEKIIEALKYDIIILSGGASGGIRDLTASIIEELGEVKIHGIAIQPGKPTIIGLINGKPIFGLPGYPTSCLTNFTLLVAPLIRKLLGMDFKIEYAKKKLAHKVFSVKGRRQFLPVRINDEVAHPILKGSGAVTSFIEADGFVEVPENVEILEEGEEVRVVLFKF